MSCDKEYEESLNRLRYLPKQELERELKKELELLKERIILTMQNDMRDRLVELIQNSVDGCASYWAELIADHLIANGVIVPPCNIGDVVYSIRTDTKVIYSCSVCEFIINKHFENIHKECKVYIIEDGRFTYFDFSSFGKTVFFTKEEAEQKLKELRENADL